MRIDGSYHGQVPAWRDTASTKQGALVGIELEVFHPEGRQLAADALDKLQVGEFLMPIAERDGSLCPERGVEIICPPLPEVEARSETGYIARLMKVLAESGVPTKQPTGYGMHVNVNVIDWTATEKLVVQYLLNRFAVFGEEIGNRKGTTRTFGRFLPRFWFLRAGSVLDTVTYAGDKHCAAWIRASGRGHRAGTGAGTVMEVRFPKSTLNITDLQRTLDYVHAVRAWVTAAPNHAMAACYYDALLTGKDTPPLLDGLFLAWCERKRPEVFALLNRLSINPIPGKRMEVMRDAITDVGKEHFHMMRIESSNDNADRKKQALRIGALIGKGARLQGEPNHNGYIISSTIRAAT